MHHLCMNEDARFYPVPARLCPCLEGPPSPNGPGSARPVAHGTESGSPAAEEEREGEGEGKVATGEVRSSKQFPVESKKNFRFQETKTKGREEALRLFVMLASS